MPEGCIHGPLAVIPSRSLASDIDVCKYYLAGCLALCCLVVNSLPTLSTTGMMNYFTVAEVELYGRLISE